MTKVLLTGGCGFIAGTEIQYSQARVSLIIEIAHILEVLLQHGDEVITTVRSEDKAVRIRNAHPNAPLTVAIVPDIVKPNAFISVVSAPGLEAVIHIR